MTFEDFSDPISFFSIRGVDLPTVSSFSERLVGDYRSCVIFHPIYPGVPHAVRELFLLTP